MTPCMLCTSPYRDEFLLAWKQVRKGKKMRVYEKYAPLMKYNSTFHAFQVMVYKHLNYHKEFEQIITPQTPEGEHHSSVEEVVQRLTDLAGIKALSLDPKDLKFRDVWAGQKVLIEAKKLRLTEDALMIALSKMFGPTILEGEEIGIPQLRPAEGSGDKPQNP